LPTLYHWSQVADNAKAPRLIPLSNFSGKGTAPVGSNVGFSSRGVYDLAGNAREWIFNETSPDGQRFILGGGWPDSPKMFVDSYTQPPMDRSSSNGFRCVLAADGGAMPAELQQPVHPSFRDYARETPVDDRTFAAYLRQFDYERKPLHARLEQVNQGAYWKHEVVSVDAGYGGETMRIHLFLPTNASANLPLQPVIFYPGSGALLAESVDEDSEMRFAGFLVKSGRVLVLPVYKSTFERRDEVKSPWPGEAVQYRDHLVMWVKDVRRAIDYLATRPDIAADRLAYFGFSWGGALGATIPAVEPRIKVVVLDGAGFLMQHYLPEVDPLNFAPRVRQPVLVLNGKYDSIFPLENALQPMFRAFGTPVGKKKLVLFDSGHVVPYAGLVRETLTWLDANFSTTALYSRPTPTVP
jgi:dipeptidyl aminopeptidase/acylaminoacyl peptidase